MVLLVFKNIPEHIAEIAVAGHHDGFLQGERGFVDVASELAVAEMVALAARIGDLCVQCAFLQAYEAVDKFEHGAWRVRSLYGSVEHRLVRVLDDLVIVLADVRQHAHIDSWTGHKCEDFSCLRFDRHEAPDLVSHQLLAVLLQIRVNRGVDVVSRYGFLVHLSVFVALLDLVAGVAKVDVVPFLSTQFLLSRGLDPGLTGIVSRAVFPGMLLYVVGVHLRDIAEQVSTGVDGIVPDASGLSPEAWELVLDLSELHVGLRLYLLEHHDTLVTDAATVPGIFIHLVTDEFWCHVEGVRQHKRVELFHLARGDKDVVGDLVADYDLAVAVIDDASGGIDDVIDHRIVVRVDLVFVIDDLDVEQLPEDDGGDDKQPDYQGFSSTFCLHGSAD